MNTKYRIIKVDDIYFLQKWVLDTNGMTWMNELAEYLNIGAAEFAKRRLERNIKLQNGDYEVISEAI